MRIREAFPRVFERAYPAVDPRTPLMSVLPLLRFHEIDAIPLSLDTDRKDRGIFGFSCLARMIVLGPKRFEHFLKQPCEDVSDPLATVQARQNLTKLLAIFLESRFGFARVLDKKEVGALITLSDALGLYETGKVSSKLVAKDVASEVFSVPKASNLRTVLKEMFAKRYRRAFLKGTGEFVWDRSIIEHIFSPAALARVANDPSRDFLDIPVTEIRTIVAREGSPNMKLKVAAELLKAQPGQCLVFDGKVVTPWDVVIKPWINRELKIN